LFRMDALCACTPVLLGLPALAPAGPTLRSFWIVPDDPVKSSAIDHSATLPNSFVRETQRMQ
jgi:hypothetical protein